MARTGKRYTEEQLIGILKEAAAAKNIGDVVRRQLSNDIQVWASLRQWPGPREAGNIRANEARLA